MLVVCWRDFFPFASFGEATRPPKRLPPDRCVGQELSSATGTMRDEAQHQRQEMEEAYSRPSDLLRSRRSLFWGEFEDRISVFCFVLNWIFWGEFCWATLKMFFWGGVMLGRDLGFFWEWDPRIGFGFPFAFKRASNRHPQTKTHPFALLETNFVLGANM